MKKREKKPELIYRCEGCGVYLEKPDWVLEPASFMHGRDQFNEVVLCGPVTIQNKEQS